MSRVIEPRNLSFVGVDAVTGAEDHADVPRGRAQRSHRGRRVGRAHKGCPGTWEASGLCFESTALVQRRDGPGLDGPG